MIVADFFNDVKKTVGICDDEAIFLIITKALQTLADKGNFDYLVGHINLCISSCDDYCFVALPNFVDTPLAISLGGRSLIPRSRWFEFGVNGGGPGKQVSWSWDDHGDFPTIRLLKSGTAVYSVAKNVADQGCELIVHGLDSNSLTLRSQNPDGSWSDGVKLKSNLVSDWPSGIPQPETNSLVKRNFSAKIIDTFTSTTEVDLETGAEVILTVLSGSFQPLVSGGSYFVAVVDDSLVALYNSRSESQADINRISLEQASLTGQFKLTDTRGFEVQTELVSVSAHSIKNGSKITFSGLLPSPYTALSEYFAYVTGPTTIAVADSLVGTVNGTGLVNSESSGSFSVLARQEIDPITFLSFSVNHNFSQGDAVIAENTSGEFPLPLSNSTYFVRYIDLRTISLHSTLADAASGLNPIIITSYGSGITSLIKTIPSSVSIGNLNNINATAHGLSSGDLVQFSTSGSFPSPISQGTVYKVSTPLSANSFTLASLSTTERSTFDRSRTSNVATITTTVAHGLLTGDIVDVENMSDATFNANQIVVIVTSSTTFTYASSGIDVVTVGDVSGLVTRGRINVTSTGSGQLSLVIGRSINIAFSSQWRTDATSLSTGDVVLFDSEGTLPTCTPTINELSQYFIRKISNEIVEIFESLPKAVDNVVRTITTRERSANIVTLTTLSPHGFIVGDTVDVSGIANYDVSRAVLTSITPTTFSYTQSGTNEAPTATSGTSRISNIKVIALGNGNLFLALNRTMSVQLRSQTSFLSSGTASLKANAEVTFQTNGTLPSPFNTATPYFVSISGEEVSFALTPSGSPVIATSIGSGNHNFTVSDTFSTALSPLVTVVNNEIKTGTKALVKTTDTLPSPLLENQTVYIRNVDGQNASLHSSQLGAETNTSPIVLQGSGRGTHSVVFSIPIQIINLITAVVKPVTTGHVELYSSEGNGFPVLLGVYEANETRPTYRVIKFAKTGESCLTMRYKKRVTQIRSIDDVVPFTNVMAIIAMCKAVYYYMNDFLDLYKTYSAEAEKLLIEQQQSREGAAPPIFQFNDAIFTDQGSAMMDSGEYL